MEIVVSGVRPTGNIHLGNYYGAIMNFVRMQEEYNSYFFIADYHALTTHPDPNELHANVKEVLVTYLACGLDPEKTVLYMQSDLPEISEMYLLFNMFAYKGELERSTTFKEKSATQGDNINAGLLTYPVLMAIDIIIHKATKVPVGKDQEQHLEMTRNFANRFNHMYGTDYFPEPHAFSYENNLVKLMGLDGTGKMGKSEAPKNTLFLNDEPEVIRKKIKSARTDSGPEQMNQEKPDYIESLFNIMRIVSPEDTVNKFDADYNQCQIRYGDFKGQLAEDVIAFVQPIQERMEEYQKNDALLREILLQGAEKARESSRQTLKDVRELMGIKRF